MVNCIVQCIICNGFVLQINFRVTNVHHFNIKIKYQFSCACVCSLNGALQFFFLFSFSFNLFVLTFRYLERSAIYIMKQVNVKCGCKLFKHWYFVCFRWCSWLYFTLYIFNSLWTLEKKCPCLIPAMSPIPLSPIGS